MTHQRITIFILLLTFSFSAAAQNAGKPVVSPLKITADGLSWAYYKRDHLRLAEDFTAFDDKGQRISKAKFLMLLADGGYLPLQLTSPDKSYSYQLFPLGPKISEGVKDIIKQFAITYRNHFLAQGKQFPDFKFTDLNGHIYTPANTKGKILVINSWFIACQACNMEMPRLNQLTDSFKARHDVLFISIAFDPRSALQQFIKRRTFKYAIVPVKESFIEDTLGTSEYPTHWIVNRKGTIVKMVNDPEEMITALNKQTGM